MSTFGVIIAGFGGQGVLLTGYLLAHAGMMEGKHVAWIPSYGPEMRGGVARCSVTVSAREISSPLVEEPDAVMAFNRPSLDKYEPTLIKGGSLYINSSLIDRRHERDDVKVYYIAANEIAESLGNLRVANLVMLGALVKSTGVVSMESILEAPRYVLPEHRHKLIPLNQKALELGAGSITVP